MKDFRVAAAQFYAKLGAKEENLDKIEKFAEEARRGNVDVLCFPEMCITGFGYGRDHENVYQIAERVPAGPATKRLLGIAARNNIILLAGISELGRDNHPYNSCVIVSPKGYIGKYRKVHMNSERPYYREGSEFSVFENAYAKIGVSICYDNTFCEPARILAIKGAEVIFAPHCYGSIKELNETKWGKSVREIDEWREREPMKFLRARARDNHVYVVFANQVGGPIPFIGGSAILDPDGNILAKTDIFGEDLVVSDLKREEFEKYRLQPTDNLKRRRPELYRAILL